MKVQVDLLQFQNRLTTKTVEGKPFVWDPIRKKYLVNQPEEMVRQLLIIYLQEVEGISKNYIAVEKSIKVNDRLKRFDLLIFDENHKPIMLIECKSPKVKVSQDTFEQIAWYNSTLKVPYLLVSNGITTYCCSVSYEDSSFSFLEKIPKI